MCLLENIILPICITISVCVCIYSITNAFKEIGKQAFTNTGSGGGKSFGLLFERILKIIVVLSVVVTVIVLGLNGIVKGESIIVLLSSLVSFTLGAIASSNNKKAESEQS